MNSRDEHKHCWGPRPQGQREHLKEEARRDLLDPYDGRTFPPGKGPSRDHADSMLSSDRCRSGGETGCRTETNPERATPFREGRAQQEGQERDRAFFLEGAKKQDRAKAKAFFFEGRAWELADGRTLVAGSACLAVGVHLEGRCSQSGLGLALPLKRSLFLQLFLFLGFPVLDNDSFFAGCAHGQG